MQNKNNFYVNFKKRIYDYTHYIHRDIPLHLKQNNIIHNSTCKNITEIIFTTTQIQMENKIIHHYINKNKQITTNQPITINNNKNKNKRVIYEALANKLRSSLQWRRHYIIYIGFIYIDIN